MEIVDGLAKRPSAVLLSSLASGAFCFAGRVKKFMSLSID
jgi:hypothetical protein